MQGLRPKWPMLTSCTSVVFLQWPMTSGCAVVGKELQIESSHVALDLWSSHRGRLLQSDGSPCQLGPLGQMMTLLGLKEMPQQKLIQMKQNHAYEAALVYQRQKVMHPWPLPWLTAPQGRSSLLGLGRKAPQPEVP